VRFVADFIGALREAGLDVSPAESLDALKAIKLLGLESRETSKTVLALTLVKRQADQVIYEELFDLYFAGVGKAKTLIKESNKASNKEADKSEIESSENAQEAKNVLNKIFDGKIPDELIADLGQEKDEIDIEHTSHQMMENNS
jgi:uncharacterized protein with von Willebrand factor type A (vWA) domain